MSIFGKPDEKPTQTPPAAPARPSAPPPDKPQAAAAPSAARTATAAPTTCLIGPKSVIKGEITGDEDLIVEGTIEGQIRITRDLRVGPGGTVKATVEAQSIIVSGEVTGDCSAATRVEIQASGRLVGNIRAPKIVIQEGAIFRGNSDMSAKREGEPLAAPAAEKKPEPVAPQAAEKKVAMS